MTEQRARLASALGDRYSIEREIGRGGMATVYLAEDLKHRRQVALKVLRPELAASIGGDRFVQEIEILAKLTHPHILPLHDSGAVGDILYFVMPYVPGESLRARLDREGPLPVEDAVRIADEVADALGHAHALGVVHRDIKPENILLEAGHAVVADFGVARAVGEAGTTRLTDTGFAVGTPAYMSPEQAAGDRSVDHRADIYALGCVLYEMLIGEAPHTGPSAQAILARVLTEEVRPLTAARPTVTPALEQAVRKSLARTPADRFSTAAEFRAALRTAADVPASAGRGASSRAFSRTALTIAGIGIVLAAIAAVWLSRSAGETPARMGLALFPFQATVPAAEEWTEQLPDLLATALDGTPGMRVADPWALWGSLRPERGARATSPTDIDEATRLARRAHADVFLLGSIRVDDDAQLGLTVRVYRIGSPEAIHTVAHAGPVDSVGSLAQQVAVDIITRLDPEAQRGAPVLEGFTTRSAQALKSYLRAREAMRRGQVDLAAAAIDSAIAIDTTFALGLVEAATIKSWAMMMRGQPFTGLVELVERAARHGDSLTPRNRLRVESIRASVRTDGRAAAAAARQLLARDSTDLEAWSSLAYYHRVYGWQYGSDARDAIDALDRAIALDSTHVPALVSMLSILEQLADERAADIMQLLVAADTSSTLARGALLGRRVAAMPDTAFRGYVDTLATDDPALIFPALRSLRSTQPDRAMLLLERLRLRQGPGIPDYRNEWARLLAAQGRFQTLDSTIQAGGFATQMIPRWQIIAPLLADVGDSGRATAAVRFLEPLIPADSARELTQTQPVWMHGWLIGAFHATFEDSAVARRWQTAIGTLPPGNVVTDYRGSIQADIEARGLARSGDRAGALAAATRAYELWGIHTENASEILPEPNMRFHRAMLLLSAGQRDSASALLQSLVPPTTWLGFLTARASLELGRVAEDRGDRSEAARHYSTAYRLWRPGDSTIGAWRDAAREGLSRTTGEPNPR